MSTKNNEENEVFNCEDDEYDYEVVEVLEPPDPEAVDVETVVIEHGGVPLLSEETAKEEKELTVSEIAVNEDPRKKDILWAVTKPTEEMTLEELMEARQRIRELRTVRVGTIKKKSDLDIILSKLEPEQCAAILAQLRAAEEEAAKVKEKEKEKEGEKKENAPKS